MLAWDLFVGRWVYLDGQKRGIFASHSAARRSTGAVLEAPDGHFASKSGAERGIQEPKLLIYRTHKA